MKLTVKNKYLELEDREVLRTGNVNSYAIDIEFDDTYIELVNYVIFKNNDIIKKCLVGANNRVLIPSEVLDEVGTLYIGFYGSRVENDKLIVRESASLECLRIEEGSYDEKATPTEDLKPDLLDTYLRQMREFYLESTINFNENAEIKIVEFNNNVEEKLSTFNSNSDNKLNNFNDNFKDKLLDFDNNYIEKKSDIDNTVDIVKEDRGIVEDSLEKVLQSEQNAKVSEENTKSSEISAQNSSNKALEIETNIISIQQNIKEIKAIVETDKEISNNNAEKTSKDVVEATKQANKSKEQADISIANAAQTSSDRTAIGGMKNTITDDKATVESFKNETEIYRNETLKAKDAVENSLQNERKISDEKYANAIKGEVDYTSSVSINSAESPLQELSLKTNVAIQETRSGKNIFNPELIVPRTFGALVVSREDDEIKVVGNSTSTVNIKYLTKIPQEWLGKTLTLSLNKLPSTMGFTNIGYKKSGVDVFTVQATLNSTKVITQQMIDDIDSFEIYKGSTHTSTNASFTIQLEEGSTATEYEKYGKSPSPDFPSEIENIILEKEEKLSIRIHGKNLLNISDFSETKNGITVISKNGVVHVEGTATANSNFAILLNTNVTTDNKDYCFSGKVIGTSPSSSIRLIKLGAIGTTSEYSFANNYKTLQSNSTVYLTDNKKETYEKVFCYVGEGATVNFDLYCQLEKGNTFTSWELFTNYITKLIKIERKNIFDGEVEVGAITAETGLPNTSADRIRSKNYIPIKSSSILTISREIATDTCYIYEYDANKKFIGLTSNLSINMKSITILTNSNTAFIKFADKSNSINNKYEIKYGGKDLFMGNINNIYDEVKKIDGKWYLNKIVQKEVIDGTNSTLYRSVLATAGTYRWGFRVDDTLPVETNYVKASMISDKLSVVSPSDTYNRIQGISGATNVAPNTIYFYIDDCVQMTLAEMKTWLANNPITVYYLTKESTQVELPQESQDVLNSLYLNTGINTISVENGQIKFTYNKDLNVVIEDLIIRIESLESLLGTAQTSAFLLQNLAKENESEVN